MIVNKIDRDYNVLILMSNPEILTTFYISTNSMIWILQFLIDFVYPPGKSRVPHLLRYRGFAVDDYSFTPGRLGPGASSTLAQLGLKLYLPVAESFQKMRRIVGYPCWMGTITILTRLLVALSEDMGRDSPKPTAVILLESTALCTNAFFTVSARFSDKRWL